MIIAKDRLILIYIEKFKFISIDQARQLTYPNIKQGYLSVMRRLHLLVYKEKKLKIFYDDKLKENLYVDIDIDIKKIPSSLHRFYLMNFYCKLISYGAEIEKFKIEKEWLNRKYRSDGIAIYIFGGHRYRNIIEVNKSNNDLNLGRFDEARDEIIKECNGKVPRLILIDDRKHNKYNTNIYKVIRLNYGLTNFSEIFL